jgi:hypothetical protein
MAGKPGPKPHTKLGRDAIWKVFHEIGGIAGMRRWAEENPGEFYTKLFPRLVPQVTEITGEDGEPMKVSFNVRLSGD